MLPYFSTSASLVSGRDNPHLGNAAANATIRSRQARRSSVSAFVRFRVPGSLEGRSGKLTLRTALLCSFLISISTALRMTFSNDSPRRPASAFNSRKSGSGKSIVTRIKTYSHLNPAICCSCIPGEYTKPNAPPPPHAPSFRSPARTRHHRLRRPAFRNQLPIHAQHCAARWTHSAHPLH